MPKYPTKQSRPKPTQTYRPKAQTHFITTSNKKDFTKRTGNSRQFLSSKLASSTTKFWKPSLSTASTATSGHSSVRKIGPLYGTMGRIHWQQIGPLCHPKQFKDTIPDKASSFICSNQNESIFFTVTQRRDRSSSQETCSGKGTDSGNSWLLFLDIPCTKKEGKVTPNYRSIFTEPINKESFKMETVKSVRKSMANNDWAVSIDLTDAYLHIPIHPCSRKYLRFTYNDISIHGLTLWNVPKSVDFHQADGLYSSASLTTHHLGFSIPRQLANKRSDPQSVNISDKILPSSYSD